MKEKHIIYRGIELHYKTGGEGLPVILIHGFSEDSRVWDNQVPILEKDYNIIVPDLPGSGRSGLINDENTGLEDYAECIKAILQEEKIDRCIMIGHSMGGYITLAFAEQYGSMLAAFGLFHSSAFPDDNAKIETRKKAIEFIRTNGAMAFLKTSIPGLFFDQSNSEPIDALIQQVLEAVSPLQVARPLEKVLIQYYKAMIARPDRTHILKNTSVPVLLIAGLHDKAVPFKHSLEQSYMPACSYIHILRNSAHMGMIEETQKANEILENFLRSSNINN